MGDESGLVSLAALGNRRQVRRVGLDQQTIQRDHGQGLAQGLSLLERDDPGNRYIKS